MAQHQLSSFHGNHRSLLLRLFHILLGSDLWTDLTRLLSSDLDGSRGKRKALGLARDRPGQQQPYNLERVALLLCAPVFSSVKWLVMRIKKTNAWKAHSTLRVASNHSAPNAARAPPEDAFVSPAVGLSMLSGWGLCTL